MPMCRGTSNMSKPEPGPSSVRPQLLTFSNTDAAVVGNLDTKSRKVEPAKTKRWRKQLRAAIARKTSERSNPT